MQEIVALKISVRRFRTSQTKANVLGLTFAKFTLLQATEDITTDNLLVSEQTVRVLDIRA